MSKPEKVSFKKVLYFLKPLALPVLLAVFPTLYHYSNNAALLTLSSLAKMLTLNVSLAIVLYLFFLLFHTFRPVASANAAFIFLIFFNVYGLVYRYLLNLDLVQVRHYNLLPLILMMAVYSIWLINKLKSPVSISMWNYIVLIFGILVILNIVIIVPAEFKKLDNAAAVNLEEQNVSLNTEYPDIYYIVLDEFAGFQAMREYWGYEGVDDFVRFLENKGFFIAEESHGSSISTLHQMATRLNYQEYSFKDEYIRAYFNDIADNRVMRYLKSRGYTTVVFDETNKGYPSSKSIIADHLYEYGSSAIPQSETGVYEFYFDEFGELVMDNTMFYTVSEKYKKNSPEVSQHRDMIYFAVDNIASREISSPKFVYVHLLFPHAPFMFDQDGNITDYEQFTNWNYYIDNYIYSIKVAEEMINKILLEAESKNPPIIIIQSDHGARNHLALREGSAILQNYPEEFKTLILYAFYMPGYDYSDLPQDIDPINTFPVVFNYLFDANIDLLE